MKFRSEINISPAPFQLDHKDPVLCLGSCFSENIGVYLFEHKFRTLLNPFGVLYNPASILNLLKKVSAEAVIAEAEIYHNNGLWHSLLHDSTFSHPYKEKCIHAANTSLQQTHSFLQKCNCVILTLGTAFVYHLKQNGLIVANCHKIPAREFQRKLLTINEMRAAVFAIEKILRSYNPEMKIIWTVSPVRHLKDGFHPNQVSKASLVVGLQEMLNSETENNYYFPAYEIMLDDLRDYRFYAKDLVHPNDLAIDYIWDKFQDTLLSNRSREIIKALKPLLAAVRHRPINTEDPQNEKFTSQNLERINRLEKQFPEIDLSAEKKHFTAD